MKKNFLLLFFIAVSFFVAKSQSYVKFKNDLPLLPNLQGKDSTSFFKNEIYPVLTEKQKPVYQHFSHPHFFEIGKDTFNVGGSVNAINQNDLTLNTSYSFQRINSKDSIIIKIDSAIVGKDTNYYFKVNNEKVFFLDKTDNILLGLNDTIKSFSLVVPNMPTKYFYVDSLPLGTTSNLKTGSGGTVIGGDSGNDKSDSNFWMYVGVGIVITIGIAFIIWKYIFKRKLSTTGNVVLVKYTKDSLTDFAERNGTTLNFLIEYNSVIPNDYADLSPKEKKKVKKEIRGQDLIIRYIDQKVSSTHNSTNIFEESNDDKADFQQKNTNNNENKEINDSYKPSETLQNKIAELESEKTIWKNEKKHIEEQNSDLNQKLTSITAERNNLKEESTIFNSKAININYLTYYSEIALEHLQLCEEIFKNATNFLNTLSKELSIPSSIFTLSLNFDSSADPMLAGSWMRTLQDIKDTGITVNNRIKDSFRQLANDEKAKVKQFKKLLFELLIPYSSSILVLSEAMSKIGYFQVKHSSINEIETFFKTKVLELVDSADKINIELKYVPLFTDYKDHFGKIESDDNERSLPYRDIQVEKDFIVEITSYGVKTEFTDTNTRIIRA